MLKQIAWNTFKSTGNIDTLLELLEVDKTLEKIDKTDEMQLLVNAQRSDESSTLNLANSNENDKIKL